MDGAGITYDVRANAFEYDSTWRLTPDALEMTGGNAGAADATITFPYKDITGLGLSYSATRVIRTAIDATCACGLAGEQRFCRRTMRVWRTSKIAPRPTRRSSEI